MVRGRITADVSSRGAIFAFASRTMRPVQTRFCYWQRSTVR
jgi:hypothetical protein